MMRLEINFERPLNTETKTRLLLALGALAKTRQIRFLRGDHVAVVFGEALGAQPVMQALADEGVVPSSITTSLDELGASLADEQPDAKKERVRAIGR
jgi:hypothetical protein